MCKFCGNPECNADELLEGEDPIEVLEKLEKLKELLGGGEMSDEEKEHIENIKRDTSDLQDEEYDDARYFTSKIWRPSDAPTVYSAVDTTTDVISSSIDSILMAQLTGEVSEDDENVNKFVDMLQKLKGIGGEPTMSFCVSVSRVSVDVRVLRNGDEVNAMKFSNVKTFDDVMKLVSYASEHFVDPLLKDRDAIKEALGEEN